MEEADGIFVTDTGSQDKTVEILRNNHVYVFQEEIRPWRFDTARNISLSHVPFDADICVCTDLDEKFLRLALCSGKYLAARHSYGKLSLQLESDARGPSLCTDALF